MAPRYPDQLWGRQTSYGRLGHCPVVGQDDRGTPLPFGLFTLPVAPLELESSPRRRSVPLSGAAVQRQGWHYSLGLGGCSVGFVMGRRAGAHSRFCCDWIPIPGSRVFEKRAPGNDGRLKIATKLLPPWGWQSGHRTPGKLRCWFKAFWTFQPIKCSLYLL